MMPLQFVEGQAHRVALANIDTDQLIPARFMKEPRKPNGYGRFLMFDLATGRPEIAPPEGASILVAGRNFGCGSSREAAVYALADFGFRVVIAPSFGDIFASNAVKNGVLPAMVSEEDCALLMASPAERLTVDLAACSILAGNVRVGFTIDPIWRTQLLNGWDDIDLTQAEAPAIEAFMARDAILRPWMAPRRG